MTRVKKVTLSRGEAISESLRKQLRTSQREVNGPGQSQIAEG